ncbi:MAG: hypothetical protein J5I81_06310 [Nitrococcus mobilis]|nr:hypothetical protein [Nitrococcus mobilis]
MTDEIRDEHHDGLKCARLFSGAANKLTEAGVSQRAILHALFETALQASVQLSGSAETAEWLRRIADRIDAEGTKTLN